MTVKHGPADQHILAKPFKASAENRVILSMSAKQSGRIEAQVSGYLSKFVMRMPNTDQLPLYHGIRSKALPFIL